MTALLGLFAAAFISASFFPLQSEGLFVALLASGQQAPWLLLLVASLGNTLGSALNWVFGRGIAQYQHKRWFPVRPDALAKAAAAFARWGKWSLLLSWLPIIGDPLTMAAGMLHMRFMPFIAIVAIAKTGRYAALMLAL
ncbi:MAG: DedA family protein [Proteobacteria bacterium]|nr:DedA family protein [Pseudomonadota bacterium]